MSSSDAPTTYFQRNGRMQFSLFQVTLQEVLNGVEERMKLLLKVDDYLITKNVDDIQYIVQATSYGHRRYGHAYIDKEEIFTLLVKMNFRDLFVRIWEKNLNGNFCDPNDDSHDEPCFIITEMTNVIVLCTDRSLDFCVDIYQSGVYKNIVKYLKLPQLSAAETKDSNETGRQQKCVSVARHLLEILLNVVQFVPDSRDPVRVLDVFPLLLRLKDAEEKIISSTSLLILAYLMTDAENNEHLGSEDKAFEYAIDVLSGSMKPSSQRSGFFGRHTVAMLSAINRLAVNDSNKQRLVKAGALPVYVKALKADKGNILTIQRLAAKGLWTLAFKCKEDIIKEPGYVEALTQLSKNSKNPNVKKQVEGVLWILNEKGQTPSTPKASNGPQRPSTSNVERYEQANAQHKTDLQI